MSVQGMKVFACDVLNHCVYVLRNGYVDQHAPRSLLRTMMAEGCGADYVWFEDEIGTEYDPVTGPQAYEMCQEVREAEAEERRRLEALRGVPVAYDLRYVTDRFVAAQSRWVAAPNAENARKLCEAGRIFTETTDAQIAANRRRYHILRNGAFLGQLEHHAPEGVLAMARVMFGPDVTIEVCETTYGGGCQYDGIAEILKGDTSPSSARKEWPEEYRDH